MNPKRQVIYALENVEKYYNRRRVVAVEALTIARGEVFAIVGPNGAGKSTLLRMLALLEPPSAGTLHFDKVPVNGAVPLAVRRRVAMVFQRPLLLNTSVRENISFGVNIRGERALAPRIDAVIARLGLGDFATVNVRTLSGGELQRVALARALVLAPEVLLLDEPTANLDPFNVNLIEEIVKELPTQENVTVVLVTHNVFQARRVASRIALMLDGKMIEVAETDAFFESPRDVRTRAFVNGEMVY